MKHAAEVQNANHLRPPVKVGVVGAGQLTREVHLPLLAGLQGVAVEALADPDRGALDRCRPLALGARTYRSLDEMLRQSHVDGVLIASPTAKHAAHAREVLQARRALYLEKPMGASLSEGTRLVEDTRTFETHAMMGFNYRFHPLAVRLRQRMKKDPEMVRHMRSVFSIAPRPLPGWKQKRASGGGVLLDLASHHFDLLRFLLDAEVVSVSARTWSERSEEDCCEGELVFSNGVRVDMLYSFCRSEQDRIELSGPRHRLLLNRYAPLTYPCRPVGQFVRYQWERRHSPWKEVSFRRSLSAWIESIRRGSLPPVTLADGLESLRVVDAAERSAQIGRPVVLNRLANREAAR